MNIPTFIVCSSKCSRKGTRHPKDVKVSKAIRMAAQQAVQRQHNRQYRDVKVSKAVQMAAQQEMKGQYHFNAGA